MAIEKTQNKSVILRLAEESALLRARLEWYGHKEDPFATLRMTGKAGTGCLAVKSRLCLGEIRPSE